MDKPKGLPHYEKPSYVVSIDEAKREYTMIWDKMSELVPNLTNEEKRRIIEIVANTCEQCKAMEIGCNCYRDE